MFLLRAVLNILVRNASPRGPMCFRCLIFNLSGPCELLFLPCFIVFVNCLVKQFVMCSGYILKLFKEISRLMLHMQTFTQCVVDSWNNLPANVVNAQSINAFKSRLNTQT